jgi:hypothetical protein
MRSSPLLSVPLLVAAFVGACMPSPSRAPARPYSPDFGPPVSLVCLEGAKNGTLLRDAPASVGAYRITRLDDRTLYVKRDGRPLTDAEGKAAFERFMPTGLSTGSSGLFSIYTCPDVPRASCLTYTMWLCQTSFDRLTGELDAALAGAGAADGEAALKLTVLEARGPRCKGDAPCALDRHYGSPKGEYDWHAPRTPLGGRGRCDRDSECEGSGNGCAAWYLQGGVENLVYIQYSEPTLCGCVHGACSWFTQ